MVAPALKRRQKAIDSSSDILPATQKSWASPYQPPEKKKSDADRVKNVRTHYHAFQPKKSDLAVDVVTSLTHDVDVSVQCLRREATPGGLEGPGLSPLVESRVKLPHPRHEGAMVPILPTDQVKAVEEHHWAVANQIFELHGHTFA